METFSMEMEKKDWRFLDLPTIFLMGIL